MIIFNTSLSFISYNVFIIIFSFLLFKSTDFIIEDIRNNKKQKKTNKHKSSVLKIGGIYGRKQINGDENNPFSHIHDYGYYVAIIDIKPSQNGDCEYCQYVYLTDNMSPYSSYSDNVIFSSTTNKFDDWEYIKDIDLETIKFS